MHSNCVPCTYQRRTAVPNAPANDADPKVRQVEQALGNSKMRQDIYELLISHGNLEAKARFCSSVLELEKIKDKRERLSKARKIVALFVHPGALFSLDELPDEHRKSLLDLKNLNSFVQLKELYMQELITNESLRTRLPDIWDKVYVCTVLLY